MNHEHGNGKWIVNTTFNHIGYYFKAKFELDS